MSIKELGEIKGGKKHLQPFFQRGKLDKMNRKLYSKKEINMVKKLNREQRELVSANRRLAIYIAKKKKNYSTRYFDSDDIIAAADEGLCKAALSYDKDKGVKFSTYAGIRIKGEIIDQYRKSEMFNPKIYGNIVVSTLNKKSTENENIEAIEMLRSRLKLPEEELLKSLIRELLQQLNTREELIVFNSILCDVSLREIGKMFNLSESRISQIRTQAIKKLRRILNVTIKTEEGKRPYVHRVSRNKVMEHNAYS